MWRGSKEGVRESAGFLQCGEIYHIVIIIIIIPITTTAFATATATTTILITTTISAIIAIHRDA